MAGDEEGPDTTSIRPISSLKSRFETLSKAQNTSTHPLPAPRPLPLSKDGQGLRRDQSSSPDENGGHRSDWTNSMQPSDDISIEVRGRPGASRNRPQSMVFLSPSKQSPLLVTVDSPKSPPKNMSLDMGMSRGPHMLTASRSADASPARLHSRTSSKPTSSALNAHRAVFSQSSSSPFSSAPREGSSVEHPPASSSSTPNKAAPPPVNRAAKPNMNIKSSNPQRSRSPAMPERAIATSQKTISPFGTPPSSGTSSPDLQDTATTQISKGESDASLGQRRQHTGSISSISTSSRVPYVSQVSKRLRTDSDASFVEPSSLADDFGEVQSGITRVTTKFAPHSEIRDLPGRPHHDPDRSKDVLEVKPKLPARPQVQRDINQASFQASSNQQHGVRKYPPVANTVPLDSYQPILRKESGLVQSEAEASRSPQSSLAQGFEQSRARNGPALPQRRPQSQFLSLPTSIDVMEKAVPPSLAPAVPPPRRSADRRKHEVSYPPSASTPHSSSSEVVHRSQHEDETSVKRDEPNKLLVSDSTVEAPDLPEFVETNRRPPHYRSKTRPSYIPTDYETRLVASCGDYVCTTGYITRAWSLRTGEQILNLAHGENIKITSMIFKPALLPEDEGKRIWLGTSIGDIHEVDIVGHRITKSRSNMHGRREVLRMFRYRSELWTLDDGGDLNVWKPDHKGMPSLDSQIVTFKIPRRHSFSLASGQHVWVASGKEIRVFLPSARSDGEFNILREPLVQSRTGDVTTGTLLSNTPDLVYFGHSDGKVSIYHRFNYTCVGVVTISSSRISSLLGVGDCIWAGFNSGMIYVYDPARTPWQVRKEWQAHDKQICCMSSDVTTFWTLDQLQVVTLGADNMLRIWDGTLEDDWLSSRMKASDSEYCAFREMSAAVCTWNAGASEPHHLQYSMDDSGFFQDFIKSFSAPPDVFVFGFQELVDLEDKKLTAKAFFKSKKKNGSEQEHMSHQYRAWRDHLTKCLDHYMPPEHKYSLLQIGSLVGLFSCIFVKLSERHRIKHVHMGEVKRGMGGLHGNKGALIARMVIDDSSICFTNCHLAAGQTQTLNRNNDIAAILDAETLPSYPLRDNGPALHNDVFTAGGDGSRILDHEICVLNGDLNYRIDTMGRDVIIKHVASNDLARLLERDQLLLSRKKNPGFPLRVFQENPITFAPTYKYNVRSDEYDTSEKRRAPAWCDRILYHGRGKVKLEEYRRWEVRVSDHRPVTGQVGFRVKTVDASRRHVVWQRCQQEFNTRKARLAQAEQSAYDSNIFGMSLGRAEKR